MENRKMEQVEKTYKPVSVVECESYVKLAEPKNAGFGNKSKSINDINDQYSHNVTDYYVNML